MPTNKSERARAPLDPKFLVVFVVFFFVSFALGLLSLSVAANYDGVAIIWLPAGAALGLRQ